ncbi:MAG: ATP-binding protein [Candidatus Aminicenantes bacterium]|nr:MAG: ATP-binding protein [Candidatus Aminicenantes bacterium]
MERFLYDQLLAWKASGDRKPLLLQGARQVGKTFLLKEFARREYRDCAYFNFEQDPQLGNLFGSSLSPDILIESLSALIGRKIEPGSTLIFFDEIQESPRAITSLKYFYEQAPEYHIVSAGSLLGVSVGKPTSFPVGKVSFMTLYPMSFFEYLVAMKENMLVKRLKDHSFSFWKPLPEIFHEKLSRLFKYYLYIGGMPEVVQDYIKKKDIENVRRLQKEILNAYARDFSKHTSPSEAIRISQVWRSIPTQLAKENKKFKYSEVKKGGRASRFESAIEWLRKAGLIYVVYNIKVPKLPLSSYADDSKFKIYMLDSGLLGALLNVPSRVIILGDSLFSQYSGAFVENFVSQEFWVHIDSGEIYYWTSNSEAEVDFIVPIGSEIFPLEVKGGLSRRTKSLRVYAARYNPQGIFRTSPRNFTRDGDFTNIPLYAISLLPTLPPAVV